MPRHMVGDPQRYIVLLLALGLPLNLGMAEPTGLETVARASAPAIVLVIAADQKGSSLKQGSGFLVSSDGKVATNQHVLQGATSATVKFSTGAYYEVNGVLAVDCKADLAILKIKATDPQFPHLRLAQDDKVDVGQRVVAIGSPLALAVEGLSTEGTVSDGIVSGIRVWEDRQLRILQTTTPVSPGSSGGPLLNLDGGVVGVVTFGLIAGQNLNFAVPSENLRPLLADTPAKPLASATCNPSSTPESQPSLSDLAGVYVGTWQSSRYQTSGVLAITLTIDGTRIRARAVLTGSPVGYEGDSLFGEAAEFADGVWTVSLEAENSSLHVKSIFQGRRLVGDYRFRSGLTVDRGQWIAAKE